MTLQIGRITGLNEPNVWANRNGIITLTGSYKATSLTDGLVRRDQLLGYNNNPDESVVPVVLTGEPRVTGYYRILGVSVDTDDYVRKQGNLYDYTVTMQEVTTHTQPMLESVMTGTLLTNVVSGVANDARQFHGVPAASLEYYRLTPSVQTLDARVTAAGTVNVLISDLVNAGPTTYTAPANFYLPAASFYIGAATFEQGASLQTVVGRQQVQNDLVNWRLQNGLVRVTPNATAGKIDVSHFNGSTWSVLKTYTLTETNAPLGLVNGFTTLSVLRNSSEETIIRLGLTTTITGPVSSGRISLDISLRRGDFLARMYLTADVAATRWKIARDTVEAATAITYSGVTAGGIRATANDADTNRYVLLSYQAAVTNDLVNGAMTQNAPALATFDFAIGSEIGGSGAGANTRAAAALARQYLAAQGESQRVVTR
jgi:hypothetical protein